MTEGERRAYNRVVVLLTPMAHIAEPTYKAGILDAMRAIEGYIRVDATGREVSLKDDV